MLTPPDEASDTGSSAAAKRSKRAFSRICVGVPATQNNTHTRRDGGVALGHEEEQKAKRSTWNV